MSAYNPATGANESFRSPIAADPSEYRNSVIFNSDGSLKPIKSAVPVPGTLDVRRTTMMSSRDYIPSTTMEIVPKGYTTTVSFFGIGFPEFDADNLSAYDDLARQISAETYREIIGGINERFQRGNGTSFVLHLVALALFAIGVGFLIGLFFVSPLLIPCIIFFVLSILALVGARVYISTNRGANVLAASDFIAQANQKHGKDGRMRWKLLQDDEMKSNEDWPFALEVFLSIVPTVENEKGRLSRIDILSP